MNLRNVLRAYSLLRQLSDDESALLNILRTLNDSDREQLVASMSDKPQKKSSKKAAGGGGKSKRATALGDTIRSRAQQKAAVNDGGVEVNLQPRPHIYCIAPRDDNGGEMPCGAVADANVHHLATHPEYHEFQPPATSAAGSGG